MVNAQEADINELKIQVASLQEVIKCMSLGKAPEDCANSIAKDKDPAKALTNAAKRLDELDKPFVKPVQDVLQACAGAVNDAATEPTDGCNGAAIKTAIETADKGIRESIEACLEAADNAEAALTGAKALDDKSGKELYKEASALVKSDAVRGLGSKTKSCMDGIETTVKAIDDSFNEVVGSFLAIAALCATATPAVCGVMALLELLKLFGDGDGDGDGGDPGPKPTPPAPPPAPDVFETSKVGCTVERLGRDLSCGHATLWRFFGGAKIDNPDSLEFLKRANTHLQSLSPAGSIESFVEGAGKATFLKDRNAIVLCVANVPGLTTLPSEWAPLLGNRAKFPLVVEHIPDDSSGAYELSIGNDGLLTGCGS